MRGLRNRRIHFFVAALGLLAVGIVPAARADSDVTFNLEGVTLLSGTTASGTVSIDVTDGSVMSEDVTVLEGGQSYEFTTIADEANTLHDTYWDSATAAGQLFELSVPQLSLLGYAGGPLCNATTANCPDELYPTESHAGSFQLSANSVNDFISAGDLASTSTPTPEPGSLALLGTGVLVGAGGLYRRFKAFRG